MTGRRARNSIFQAGNRWIRASSCGILFGLLLTAPSGATSLAAQNSGDGAGDPATAASAVSTDIPTWSRDVAPIIQRSCQQCHRTDGIGPMPLLTYEQTVPFAPLIRYRVEQRIMPPWHHRQDGGHSGLRERHLPQRRRDRDHRAVGRRRRTRGRPRRHAAAHRLPACVQVGARGRAGPARLRGEVRALQRSGQRPGSVVGTTRWSSRGSPSGAGSGPRSSSLRIRWASRSCTMGTYASCRTATAWSWSGWGSESGWDRMPEGVGKLLLPGPARISWGLHYFPIGTPVPEDVVEAGVWLYPPDYEPELSSSGEQRHLIDGTFTAGPRARDLHHPAPRLPHAGARVRAGVPGAPAELPAPLCICGAPRCPWRPSIPMVAGRCSAGWTSTTTTGRSRTSTKTMCSRCSPRGPVLLFHSQFDNTANNPINPDPDQWVLFGARGVDEMSHAWGGDHLPERGGLPAAAARTHPAGLGRALKWAGRR